MLSSRLESGYDGTTQWDEAGIVRLVAAVEAAEAVPSSAASTTAPIPPRSVGGAECGLGVGWTCLLPLSASVSNVFFGPSPSLPSPLSLSPFGPSRTMLVASLYGVWPRRSPLKSRNAPGPDGCASGGGGGNGLLLAYEFAWLQSRPPSVRLSLPPSLPSVGLSCVS